jgi:acetyl-CoA acetyltransferase
VKPAKRVFVVGGAHSTYTGRGAPGFVGKGHPDFGKVQNPSMEDHLREVVLGSLADAGVDPALVDKGYVGNFLGELFVKQGQAGALVARVCPALDGKPFARTEAACASGGVAVLACVDALQGSADVCLAAGVEIETTVGSREAADFMARAAHYAAERALDDFLFPHLFARRVKAYMDEYGVSREDIARAVVKAYRNGQKNPRAHMRAVSMDLETAVAVTDKNLFLTDPVLRPYMTLTDCSQLSDGASALILANEAGLEKIGIREEQATEITGIGYKVAGLGLPNNPLRLENAARAAAEAYGAAGVGPAEVGVAELHDCFSISEIELYEAVGFAPQGKGTSLLQDGATEIDGRIPVNTGGGLMSFGHPVGATGVKQVLEVHRQLLGKCGGYQVPRAPHIGLSANIGGDDRTAVVVVQKSPW